MTATAELFRRHGYHGTSLKQVTVAGEAPFGSLYHFFPGGKQELAEAVIDSSGRAYQELFEVIYDAAGDPGTAISDFFDGAAEVLEQTDYIDPCPIGSVALEVASTDDRLRRATERVFASWTEAATTRLEAAGVDRADAEELATDAIDWDALTCPPDAIEAFGRAPLEAIATGAVAILPEYLEAVFGPGALYAQPDDVQGLVKQLADDAGLLAERREAGWATVHDRFGPESYLDRLARLAGTPSAAVTAPAGRPPVFEKSAISLLKSLGKAAGMRISIFLSGGPASSSRTRLVGSADSRFASTQPAAPAPTMM